MQVHMPKTVTIRLSDENYSTFSEAAKAENRSLSNLIETAALAKVREQQPHAFFSIRNPK